VVVVVIVVVVVVVIVVVVIVVIVVVVVVVIVVVVVVLAVVFVVSSVVGLVLESFVALSEQSLEDSATFGGEFSKINLHFTTASTSLLVFRRIPGEGHACSFPDFLVCSQKSTPRESQSKKISRPPSSEEARFITCTIRFPTPVQVPDSLGKLLGAANL